MVYENLDQKRNITQHYLLKDPNTKQTCYETRNISSPLESQIEM